MHRKNRLGLAGRAALMVPLLMLGLAFAQAKPAAAATECTTTITGGTINTSVVVPAGASCTLDGVNVIGGVSVGAGATLNAYYSDIRSNLTGNGAYYVYLIESVVRGSVTVSGTTDVAVFAYSEIRGGVTVVNGTAYVDVHSSAIRGTVTVSGGTGTSTQYVDGNTIRGNLVCENNLTPPTVYGNTVRGNTVGQCAGQDNLRRAGSDHF